MTARDVLLEAGHAVDGDPTPVYLRECCAGTKPEVLSWWILDFGLPVAVASVRIVQIKSTSEFVHVGPTCRVISQGY